MFKLYSDDKCLNEILLNAVIFERHYIVEYLLNIGVLKSKFIDLQRLIIGACRNDNFGIVQLLVRATNGRRIGPISIDTQDCEIRNFLYLNGIKVVRKDYCKF